MKQTQFFNAPKPFYGGKLNKGKRKEIRPLSRNRPIHLVLKCRSNIYLRKSQKRIKALAQKYGIKFGVKIISQSVQGDHWHLVIVIFNRDCYKKFIRSLTSQMTKFFGKNMWALKPFTRVASWGRGLKNLLKYVEQNELEITGKAPYLTRQNYYTRFLCPD